MASASGLDLDRYFSDEPEGAIQSIPLRPPPPAPPNPFNDGYQHVPSRHTSMSYSQASESIAENVDNVRRPGVDRFVIAVDYGTTYTGLAFATTNAENADLKKIEVLQDWTSTMNNQQKVRTMFSYGKPGQPEWGTDVSEDAVTMVNTKLELGPRETRLDELESTLHLLRGAGGLTFENIRKCGPEPAFTPNSPTQIVTDYLTKIRESACRQKNIDLEQLARTKTPVDLVITVPVNWPYQAKDATFKAFRGAGFNRETFPTLEDTILVSEPEAASYFTARDLANNGTEFLEEKHCFVLCDAGGGTVDVVSFQVAKSGSNLKLQKATAPKSGRCGSVFIDTAFKKWLLSIIGPDHFNRLDPGRGRGKIYPYAAESGQMRELIKRFEVQKKLFGPSSGDVKIDLPGPLRDLNIEGRVREGELTIFRNEMESMFSYCINGVLRLIDGQIDQVSRVQKRRVKNVFLVGGFGASPYLQDVLEKSLLLRKPKITMRRPDRFKSWTAVVQGAVIYGIEKYRHPDAESMSAVTKSYGIMVNQRSDGKWRFQWLIRKGDLVLRHEKRVTSSSMLWLAPQQYQPLGKYDLKIYAYNCKDDDEVPDWWEDGQFEVDEVLRVSCDVSRFRGRAIRQNLPYPQESIRQGPQIGPLTCRMQLCGTTLEVDVLHGETVVGSSHIQVELDQSRRPTSDLWHDEDEDL